MQTYHIINGSEFYSITEAGGTVIRSSSVLDWSVGLSVGYVRDYATKKGWAVVPLIDESSTTVFEYEHSTYELLIEGRSIKRIMKNNREITWKDLPAILKGLI